VTLNHPPGGRLPSLSARPAVTFPAEERHRQQVSIKADPHDDHTAWNTSSGVWTMILTTGELTVKTSHRDRSVYSVKVIAYED